MIFFQSSTVSTVPSQRFPMSRNPLIYMFSTASDSVSSSSEGISSRTKSSLGGSSSISETMI